LETEETPEIPAEEEPAITEPPLEMEMEPELAVEAQEETIPPALDEARESLLETEETPEEEKTIISEPLLDIEPEPAGEPYEAIVPPVLDEAPLEEPSEIPLEEEPTISELSLDIEPEPEPAIELQEENVLPVLDEAIDSPLETAHTPAEEEPVVTEPSLEIELEPELAIEAPTTQPAIVQEDFSEEDNLDIWADLLPEPKNEEEPAVEEEAATTLTGEEEPFEGADFWDQVLENNSQESKTDKTEVELQPVASAPVDQDTGESETLTDEELWKQAFPGEEELEPVASQSSEVGEEVSPSEVPPLVIGANVNLNEDAESKESQEYGEEAYADYDDDDDEFELQKRKRKIGPFTIPHGKRGDRVITGVMVVFLLLAGGIYFTMQTFAPDELTDIQTAETEVPEGLTPREVPLDKRVENQTASRPEKTPDTPGDKGEAILSDPAKILEESPEEKGILKDLAESQILKDTGKAQTARIDQSALQGLTGHSVTMSTIMPVAYNPTDIRVLSFSVEIQLSDAQSAKRVRESLPVYEEVMNQAVEDFLRRKFYNDILYVKEKLQKRLQTAMNQSLKNGRVRKTKFTDFAIQ
jgi:flagellar basal body-associated protein FliL